MIIHINKERYARILSQCLRMTLKDASQPIYEDIEYHLLQGESGICDTCKGQFDSVEAETPAQLETIKWKMSRQDTKTESI